jgi:hypothetical protein
MDEAKQPDIVDSDGEPKRNFRRVLEDRASDAEAKAEALESELVGLKRTEAFRQAGLDPTDARQSYFVKGYDGEVDADAIRQAALTAGFITETDQGVQAPGQFREELAAQQRVADASLEGQPVANPGLNDQIAATTNPAELKVLMKSAGYEFNVQG